ncbi:MAG TPA: ornithine carbamoyltransferase [Dehalococcoidia bacterium]|jgi:ornithine carbamoyltransferase
MRGRHLLTVGDLDARELSLILDTSARFKAAPPPPLLAGKSVALLFEKPSLRTRVSFDVGVYRLGGHLTYLSPPEVGLGVREAVKDVARVLSGYVDLIAARTMTQSTVEELASYASVPVINALSDTEHPCQALADLLTIQENCGRLAGVRIAYIGDGNNVAASLVQSCALMGMDITLASPEGYDVPETALARARGYAEKSGGSITIVREPEEAVTDVQVIYTDVWVSMGQEEETASRREAFAPYQVDMALLRRAPAEVIVMHDLPAHRGEEITDEVMESSHSRVFQQAENRMYTEQAAMALILGD